jgi:hypothetical protein
MVSAGDETATHEDSRQGGRKEVMQCSNIRFLHNNV